MRTMGVLLLILTLPVVFSPPQNEEPRMLRVEPEKWRSLCGRQLDWVEVTAPT